jgi:hypothetical protein
MEGVLLAAVVASAQLRCGCRAGFGKQGFSRFGRYLQIARQRTHEALQSLFPMGLQELMLRRNKPSG